MNKAIATAQPYREAPEIEGMRFHKRGSIPEGDASAEETFGCGMVVRSKSLTVSRTIEASTCPLFIAQANDIALKQRLLMFRGMPPDCSAISR